MNELFDKARLVLKTYDQPEKAVLRDADTVLDDILEDIPLEINGVGPEIINVFLESKDHESIAKFFEALTGTSFEEYLDRTLEAQAE